VEAGDRRDARAPAGAGGRGRGRARPESPLDLPDIDEKKPERERGELVN
jgi:hypothetical protein